jgi:uncharacterized protein
LLLLLVMAVGHISLWIWLFNRVNALGLERKTIKRLEKSVVLLCLALPFVFGFLDWRLGYWGTSWHQAWQLLQEPDFYKRGSIATLVYFGTVLVFLIWIGPRWLAHRPVFTIAKDRYRIEDRHVEKHLHRMNPKWVTGAKTRYSLAIPGNEILSLERNRKRIHLDGVDPLFDGMRIGHISDIHLMGEIAPDFTRYCVDWVMSQGVELLVLSGDLVDDAEAVPHLRLALGELPSELPKFFVLGNHDRAHNLVEPARDAMNDLGWLDAGAQDWRISVRDGQILVVGNELPWLDRHTSPRVITPPHSIALSQSIARDTEVAGLILGVSHSPDQLEWGRSLGCQLLLCGHTHGGQVRIPGVGPIIAPSWHGSRFASGVFFKAPTVMHVSRGVSGTHPLRWRCPPEVSVLELACATNSPRYQ